MTDNLGLNNRVYQILSQNSQKAAVDILGMRISTKYKNKFTEIMITETEAFGTAKADEMFNHRRYWQGPTWVNTNWLIIDGLDRYGFKEEAQRLKSRTIELVEKSGFSEYFSPIDGFAAGISPF